MEALAGGRCSNPSLVPFQLQGLQRVILLSALGFLVCKLAVATPSHQVSVRTIGSSPGRPSAGQVVSV